jgi:TonB family protein
MLNKELPFRYPPALYAQKVQGNVTLRIYIDSNGAIVPDSTRVAETSGFSALDSAAMKGSRDLKFDPAKTQGQPVPVFPEADQPTGLPSLRVDAEAGFACTGFSIRGLPAIGIQSSRNDPPLAVLVLDAEQLGELLDRARELLGTSA